MNEPVTDDLIVHEKFLIRASSSDLENALCIPLIHFIHENFSKCEIDIILDEGQFNPFNLLPFPVRTFTLPHEKSTIAGVHHFAYNLKEVFNIDYYIDLAGGIKEAVLGASFKAIRRIGFATGMHKYLLTDRIELGRRPKTDRDYMLFAPPLVENYDAEKLFKVKAVETMPPAVQGEAAFLLVIIDTIHCTASKNQIWLDFFDSLIGERIAIYINHIECDAQKLQNESEESAKSEGQLLLEMKKSFTDTLDPRNRYIHIPNLDAQIFRTLASATVALITDQSFFAIMGSYLLKNCYCFVPMEKSIGLEYFEKVPLWVYLDSHIPVRLIGDTQSYELTDMSELIDHVLAVPKAASFPEEIDDKEIDEDK